MKNINTKTYMIIAGIGCASLAVLAILAVAFWSLSVVFVFPPAVFSIVLITSAFSLDSAASSKKPTKRVKQEEEYVSPFFVDDEDVKKKGKKK